MENQRSKGIQELVLFVVISVAIRAMYLAFFSHCISLDFGCWQAVGDMLRSGGNPYNTTHYLSWPPLWMLLIFLFKSIAVAWQLSFFTVVRVFLILVETAVAVLLYAFMSRFLKAARPGKLLIWGIALNPVAVFQVCQHCNFDVLVGFWILLAVYMLLRFQERHELAYWLCACFALGMGAVTKTVPILLAPLLLLGARKLKLIELFLGGAFLFGPTVLGVGTLYALGPEGIRATILSYRGGQGAFGCSGVFAYLGAEQLQRVWPRVFELAYGTVALCVGLWLLRKERIEPGQLVSVAALLLIFIPALGPGYGIQYVYWYLPLLILLYAVSGRGVKVLLLLMYGVAAAVYAVSYGFNFNSYGAFVLEVVQTRELLDLSQRLSTKTAETLLGLPLWILYLLFTGFWAVRIGRQIIRDVHCARLKEKRSGRIDAMGRLHR